MRPLCHFCIPEPLPFAHCLSSLDHPVYGFRHLLGNSAPKAGKAKKRCSRPGQLISRERDRTFEQHSDTISEFPLWNLLHSAVRCRIPIMMPHMGPLFRFLITSPPELTHLEGGITPARLYSKLFTPQEHL